MSPIWVIMTAEQIDSKDKDTTAYTSKFKETNEKGLCLKEPIETVPIWLSGLKKMCQVLVS